MPQTLKICPKFSKLPNHATLKQLLRLPGYYLPQPPESTAFKGSDNGFSTLLGVAHAFKTSISYLNSFALHSVLRSGMFLKVFSDKVSYISSPTVAEFNYLPMYTSTICLRTKPGANPLKKFFHKFTLLYFLKHSDWMLKIFNLLECLKINTITFIGFSPVKCICRISWLQLLPEC